MLLTGRVTAASTLTLIIFILIGYILARKKVVPDDTASALSKIFTTVFYPAYMVSNLTGNFDRKTIAAESGLILWGTVFLAAVILVSVILSIILKKTGLPFKTLIYIFAFPNTGYFGYPVIKAVFGGEVLAKTILFMIPVAIAIPSLGYYFLTSGGARQNRQETGAADGKRLLSDAGAALRKTLLSPPVLGVIAGCLLCALDIELPDMLAGLFDSAGACMSPVSMLVTGLVLGKFSPGMLFKSRSSYLICAVRLIGMPLISFAVLKLTGAAGIMFLIPFLMTAMPVGLNTVIFAESAGMDASENSRVCFVSYLMGALTIPVAFAVGSLIF